MFACSWMDKSNNVVEGNMPIFDGIVASRQAFKYLCILIPNFDCIPGLLIPLPYWLMKCLSDNLEYIQGHDTRILFVRLLLPEHFS